MSTFTGTRVKCARYGWLVMTDVTNIKELFANQTVIEPIKFEEFDKWLGFSGGNVAIEVTGFIRGASQRRIKAVWEIMRNVQALLAHIPGTVLGTGIGYGQISLYVLLTFLGAGTFFSKTMTQTSMAIKTMEFEEAGRYQDVIPYSIVFEKLSWGIVQYIIDIAVSVVYGVILLPMRELSDKSPSDVMQSFLGQNSNRYNPIGDDVEELPDPVEDTNEVGQISVSVTDDSQEFPNIPHIGAVKPDIDRTLEWKVLPFLEVMPQSFSFTLGDDFYESVWKIIDVRDEDGVPEYYIRLELKKNGEYIYLGKITEQMQFIFDKDINIYISNFKISATQDGLISHTITGMIAESA